MPVRVPRHTASASALPRARAQLGSTTGAVFSQVSTPAPATAQSGGPELGVATGPQGQAPAETQEGPDQAGPDTPTPESATPEADGGAQEVSGAALSAGAGAGAAAQDGVARSNPPKPKRKTARKPAAPMPVRLPRVPAVNLNAIRTPVVRGPPLQATAKADKIAKTTGSTPSQHHANIQAAVVRVSEAARKSQRDMVQGVDSIALNTRWSVERMADGIDGVVDRCVASVNGAATAALTTLKDAVRVHEGVIATHTQAGAEELATQQAAVDAQIMANLNVGGSEVMLAAHQNLIAAYDIHLEGVTPKLHALSDGTTPVPLTSEHGEVAETTFDAPKSGITTFEGAAAAIAQTLLTIPGAGTTVDESVHDKETRSLLSLPEVFVRRQSVQQSPYYRAYMDRGKAHALPFLKDDARAQWDKELEASLTQLGSAQNRSRFILTSLQLVAPTMQGLKRDEALYSATLDAAITEDYEGIEDANRQAIAQMRRTLDGVCNFFDPRREGSQPQTIAKGLRDNGAKIKAGMYDQARVMQASFRASVAGMAAQYPDLVTRLDLMLQGDDLMREDVMLPRIEGVSDSVQALLQGQLAMMRAQARDALDQTREGYGDQVKGMWGSVGDALSSFEQSKLKGLFHFEMERAMFTGDFTTGMQSSTQAVQGYAETTARNIMRPVVAGDEAGGRIDVLAVNHFNRFLQTQYGRHLLSVEGLPKRIGQGEAPSTSATKSFPKIEGERQKKLIEHANLLTVAVPEVDLGKMARTYGMGLLAAPVTGGLSMTVAVGAVGYQAINSIPSASDAATALAMPWPGPLAMDAVWQQLPEAQAPSAQARIAKQVATAINPNWAKLLKLFSTSETEAASAKADLVTDAAWAWGINDGAVAKLAQSFSPTELALLEPSQLKAMSASIKSNLSKTEFEIAQAYIDGNPARAAAVRLEDALVEMRRTGDTAVAAFGVKADQILRAEMENASTSGFVCNAMLQQMTDQMYVEMAARIPEPGQARSEPITGAAAPGAVGTSTHTAATGATAQAYSNPHNTDKGPDVATRHSALQSDANARANVTPNAQSVKDAKLRVLGHVTRDYVQFNTMYSLAFDGGQDDWLAEDIARLSGTKNAYAFQLSDTRRIQGDMIFDTMSADNRTMIEAYIMNGPTSPEYKDAKAASTFNTANQSVFGTSEAEVIAVVQEAGSQQLYEARDLYQRLQAAPNPDPVKVQDARRRMQAAQDAQDRKIMALARNLGGEEEGEALTLEVARTRVSERVNQIAKSFDPSMAGIGEELIREGRMNLAVGANAATSGMGTYDDLLMHVTSSRTRSDLAGFQIDRAALGVGPGNLDFWTETSGDQAQKLEINLMGIPENDRQRMEVANVQTRHDAHDGTGFIANVTMADTWQKEQMLQSHAAMGARARTALDAYIAAHPDEVIPPEIRALTGAQLMPLGGEIHPFVDKLMDADGNLIGAGPTLGMLMSESQVANTAYRSEIARQEAFFTAGITALTIAASVLLLLIPGVNVVAAGILVALVGGAATIAVKAGMRGDRYGWEEAAVDVAKTGIEAAMGGIGGALGGAVKAGTPVLGTIAKVGSKINGAFGKLGGTLGKASAAAVREGITSSVSGVANTALDDRIWSKGTSAGLGELFKAGTRGAVTGALSGGLSEGISQGLTRRMTPGLPEGVDATQLSRLGARLGPAGRDALQEAVSGTAGTLSSETANILFDLSEGKAKFNLADLALRLGKAGFKDFITSGVKAGIKNQFKATYLAQRDRIMRDSAEVSPSDAKFLRKLAISAGMETYGKDTSNPHAKDASARFTSDSAFHQELLASRAAFRNLPPDLQAHAAGMSYQHIAALGQLRETGADGYQGDPKDLSLDLATTYPEMNVKSLLQAVGRVRGADKQVAHHRRMAAQKRQGVQSRTRKRLTSSLPPEVRAQLSDLPVGELSKLPLALQRRAAQMIAEGEDATGIARLLQEAETVRTDAPVDRAILREQLEGLIAAHPIAQAGAAQKTAQQRTALADALPPELGKAVGRLSAKEAAFVHRVLHSEDAPSAKVLAHLENIFVRHVGTDARADFTLDIINAQTRVHKSARDSRRTVRAKRADVMAHVPKALRDTMGHLGESDLLAVAFAQAGTVPLGDAQITRMIARAQKEAPETNGAALEKAIRKTIRRSARTRPFYERVAQRRALISFVPKHMRGAVRRTPILSVPDHMFAAYVKSHADGTVTAQDQAVTLRLNGQVVIVVRDGAPGHVLREEGYHVLQMRDPNWDARLSQLDEETMQMWPSLPAARKVALARIAIDAEIDAHHAMLAGLDARGVRAVFGRQKRQIAHETTLAESRLESLMRRSQELSGLSATSLRAMDAGLGQTPAWLAQPGRLFAKTKTNKGADAETQTPAKKPVTVEQAKADLESTLDAFDQNLKTKHQHGVDPEPFVAQIRTHLETAQNTHRIEALSALTDRYVAMINSTTGAPNTKKYAQALTVAASVVASMQSDNLLNVMSKLMLPHADNSFNTTEIMGTWARLTAVLGVDRAFADSAKGDAVAAALSLALADGKAYKGQNKSSGVMISKEYASLIKHISGGAHWDRQKIGQVIDAMRMHYEEDAQAGLFKDSKTRAAVRAAVSHLAGGVNASNVDPEGKSIEASTLGVFFGANGKISPDARQALVSTLGASLGGALKGSAVQPPNGLVQAMTHARGGQDGLLHDVISNYVQGRPLDGAVNTKGLSDADKVRIKNLTEVAKSLGGAFEDASFVIPGSAPRPKGEASGEGSDAFKVPDADIARLLFFTDQMMHSETVRDQLQAQFGLSSLEGADFARLIARDESDAKITAPEIYNAITVLHDYVMYDTDDMSGFALSALRTGGHPNDKAAFELMQRGSDGAFEKSGSLLETSVQNYAARANADDARKAKLLLDLGEETKVTIEKRLAQKAAKRELAGSDSDRATEKVSTGQKLRRRHTKTNLAHAFTATTLEMTGSSLGQLMKVASKVAGVVMKPGTATLRNSVSPYALIRMLDADGDIYKSVVYMMQGSGEGDDRVLSPFILMKFVVQRIKGTDDLKTSHLAGESYPMVAKKLVDRILSIPGMKLEDVDTFARLIALLADNDQVKTVDRPSLMKRTEDMTDAEMIQHYDAMNKGNPEDRVDEMLHLVAHILGGSEANRDEKSIGTLLIALTAGAHLRAVGSDTDGQSRPVMPVDYIFGHHMYRSGRLGPFKDFYEDPKASGAGSDDATHKSKAKVDTHAAHKGAVRAFLKPNLQHFIDNSSGLASFTKMDYLKAKAAANAAMRAQSQDAIDALEPAGAHSIIKRDAALVDLAIQIVDQLNLADGLAVEDMSAAEIEAAKFDIFAGLAREMFKLKDE